MRSTSSRLRCVVVFLLASATLRAQTPAIPAAVRASLDKSHPGWAIVPSPDATTSTVAAGDFDGDGAPDYAAFIVYRAQTSGTRGSPEGRVMAFLKTDRGYRAVNVTGPIDAPRQQRIGIRTLGKGTEQYDLNENRKFTLERDGIRVSPLNSGPCHTFVYRGEAFVGFWTCD